MDLRAIEELRQNKIRHMDVIFRNHVDATEFEILPQVISVQATNNHLHITLRGEVDSLVKQIARHEIEDLTFMQPNLEDFFMSFYGSSGQTENVPRAEKDVLP